MAHLLPGFGRQIQRAISQGSITSVSGSGSLVPARLHRCRQRAHFFGRCDAIGLAPLATTAKRLHQTRWTQAPTFAGTINSLIDKQPIHLIAVLLLLFLVLFSLIAAVILG